MIPLKIELRSICLSGLVLVAGMLTACGDKPASEVEEVIRPAKLMTINIDGNGITREYPGTVSATQSVELGFEVAGKIVELPISDGLAVKKGTLLGKLDDSDFVAARQSAEANRKATDSAHERAKRIFDQGAGSQAEIDKTLRDIDVAKQELVKAQKALNDTVLKAPFTGRVARKIADNFQNVQAKQSIVLLEDISSLELDVNVPEQDFSRMKPGLSLKQRNERVKPEIQISTIANRSFKARLISFETSADPVTRTYRATFAFDNPDDVHVLPGMTAKVVLSMPVEKSSETIDQGMLIPATAVVTNIDGSAYVWKFDPGSSQVSKAIVTIGDMGGANILVLSGLHGGEQIATAGAAHLREGMKVRPLGE
jgi:RND family efflux transporter MFP subunit